MSAVIARGSAGLVGSGASVSLADPGTDAVGSDNAMRSRLLRGLLGLVALAAVSCAERAGAPVPAPAPRRMPFARTTRPVVGLSFDGGAVHVTTASWLPSERLFGRFEDPRDAVAKLKNGSLTLDGPGADAQPVARSPGADPVGPWSDADVRPGTVESEAFEVSWISHGPVRSVLRFETPRGALSGTYAEIAYREGGASPGRFLLAGGVAVREKATGRTLRFLRGRGPASVERAIAEAEERVGVSRSFPSNRVSSVWLSRGEAWVGTFDAGLCRVDLATGRVERPRAAELMPRGISTLLKAGDLVYAGSFLRGLWVLDARAGSARRVGGVLGRRVNRLLLVGDTLWVGTDDGVSALRIAPAAREMTTRAASPAPPRVPHAP